VNRYMEELEEAGEVARLSMLTKPDDGILCNLVFYLVFVFVFVFLFISNIITHRNLILILKWLGRCQCRYGHWQPKDWISQVVPPNLGSPIQPDLINFADKNLFLLSSITAPHNLDIYIHICLYLYLYLYLYTLRPCLRGSVPRGPVQQQMTSYRRGEDNWDRGSLY
jgi:hypothetical protein